MSSFLTGPVAVVAQTLHSSSADQYHNLGDTVFSNDGRAFRYCKAGIALVAGQLQQSQAQDTDTQNLTAAAAAVDDLAIAASTTVTVAVNEYTEGFILITVTPGVGRQYKIKGHAAFAAAAPTFNLAEPVRVALTTTSRFDAVANPFSDVIVNPTTITGLPVGVAVHPISASQFGWLQVGGISNVLVDGTGLVGVEVQASNAVAGAVEPALTTNIGSLSVIGIALTAITDTEYGAVKLDLL